MILFSDKILKILGKGVIKDMEKSILFFIESSRMPRMGNEGNCWDLLAQLYLQMGFSQSLLSHL